jgi:hypothetical protein
MLVDRTFSDIDEKNPYPQELYTYLNSLDQPASKAGYSVNFIANRTTDVLFLTGEVLDSSYRDLSTILLHELAHCLIDSDQDQYLDITEEARSLGATFYQKLNAYTEPNTGHTTHFCQVLALGAINFNQANSFPDQPLFPSAADCIRSALRYEQMWE